VEQHAEEAAFLWLIRSRAVDMPQRALEDLAELDDRVEAHLDGLRIAGAASWELCRTTLSQTDAGEIFATAILAFESGDASRIGAALEVGSASPELARGIISALGWMPFEQAGKHIYQLFCDQSPRLRRIALASSAAHRRDPGQPLIDALGADDPALRARALRAAGELGRVDLAPILREHLADEDEHCRFYAAWSAALLAKDADAIVALKTITESGPPYREQALRMALLRMDLPAAHAWRGELARRSDGIRSAVIGAGVIGDPESLPWLLEQMSVPALSRAAGEAFTMITGVDLAASHLDGEKIAEFESGPNDDPEDEDVEMDPDEFLPWPKVGAVTEWSNRNLSSFQAGSRYLAGRPINPTWLQEVLREGNQRQRAAAALELSGIQSGEPLFETRAPGFRQIQLLGAFEL
jgi:uncharacterized protein (TIGR02270 family)